MKCPELVDRAMETRATEIARKLPYAAFSSALSGETWA